MQHDSNNEKMLLKKCPPHYKWSHYLKIIKMEINKETESNQN